MASRQFIPELLMALTAMPIGIEGLVIGVFCNLIAFAVTNKLSTNNAE